MKKIACNILVMFFITALHAQHIVERQFYSDTNKIISIQYPPITEREGKGLTIPVPPAEHPRLYLTRKDIPLLKEKNNSIVLKNCWGKIKGAAAFITNGYLKLDANKAGNNDINIRNAIEAKALLYLFSNDQEQGRQTVDYLLHYYATLKIDMHKDDVCREIGRAIVTGAIVYDWCYALITAAEKQILIGQMETLATHLEIEWPKLKQGSITGHGAEAQLARDMLSCGVATYNEKPEIYRLAAGRIMAEFVPSRKFFYPAAYHHQGSSYGPYRFYWDMVTTFIFDKMGYPEIFGSDQRKAPYYFIYGRRPDGQLMRNGDDFTELFTKFGKYWVNGGTINALAGSYFKDTVLVNEAMKEDNLGKGGDYLFDFLFYDTQIAGHKSPPMLPFTRYFKEPFGAMIARTGWEDGLKSPAVVAEMKVGVYNFVNHQHLDAGSFQLYYKGPLTVQSGVYQGKNGGYGSEHFRNYYQRSIAHNTMLIYDPNEKFIWGDKEVINDGGQRLPNNNRETTNLSDFSGNEYNTGEVLAHAFGPDSTRPEFSYLKGNLAPAYSSKVKSFTRSFVFLNFKNSKIPAALIVFDNVITANTAFKKYWLLHSVEEPVVNNNTTVIARSGKGYSGKMINTTLLPDKNNFTISKIGGAT
ncbi:MAG: heparinase II/III family protein, partial [Bacteroidota bacterium]|nr:heparinase II/III family protein [Bacteroidota bacterium]